MLQTNPCLPRCWEALVLPCVLREFVSPQVAPAQSRMADSVEDVLADLLGFDEDPPVPPPRGSRLTCAQVSSRGALEEDPGGKFPGDDVGETQDLDDLDAEILGISRSRPRPAGAGTGAGKSLGKQLDPEEGVPGVPPRGGLGDLVDSPGGAGKAPGMSD
ncbi:fas-binding factor 1 homolog, partial [Corapipo altera]|uniref:fas-binding factor 1 homolog n=1 Tax=Corapipo altera TaxID=415028 RepID=UPI000FD6A0D1